VKSFRRLGGCAIVLMLWGCQKAAPPAAKEEAKAQNAFTDYVDRGVTTMHKADAARDTMDARTKALEQQAQSVQE
jgi:hypothetical protein